LRSIFTGSEGFTDLAQRLFFKESQEHSHTVFLAELKQGFIQQGNQRSPNRFPRRADGTQRNGHLLAALAA
jgi:hypothetical protein